MPFPSSQSISSIPIELPTLENYEIVDILGEGGSGITYRAKPRSTEFPAGKPDEPEVAIKALSLSAIEDWKILELFEREAQILSQLDRDGIPRYIDYFHTDGSDDRHFYIVQELAPGKTLQHWVQSGWRASEDEIKDIAAQVLKTLIYLHRQHPPIVHRDLKPTNILRTEAGKIYLVDFGAVRQTYHDTFMRGSTVVGTFGYMAPEQFRSHAVPATDLYGLGATILYLLTQRSPAEIPQEGLRLNFRDRLEVSHHFTDWLEKMLEPDLARRFSSAAASLSALNKKQVNKRGSGSASEFKIALTISSILLLSIGIIFDRYKFFFLAQLGVTSNEPFMAMRANPSISKIRDYLDRGFDVNARNQDNRSLLNVALHSQPDRINEIIELLIDRGADVSDESNPTIQIWNAMQQGDTGSMCKKHMSVQLLFKEQCEQQSPYSRSMLKKEQEFIRNHLVIHAVQNNQPNILKKLVDRGIDVSRKHRVYESNLLHLAAMYPDGAVMKILLDRGIDPNDTDPNGCNPLHHAIYKYSTIKSKRYTYNSFINDELRLDVNSTSNDLSILYLIQKGVDLNKECVVDIPEIKSYENRDFSPLELAAKIGDSSVVSLIKNISTHK